MILSSQLKPSERVSRCLLIVRDSIRSLIIRAFKYECCSRDEFTMDYNTVILNAIQHLDSIDLQYEKKLHFELFGKYTFEEASRYMNTHTILSICMLPDVWVIISQYLEELNRCPETQEEEKEASIPQERLLTKKDVRAVQAVWTQARNELLLGDCFCQTEQEAYRGRQYAKYAILLMYKLLNSIHYRDRAVELLLLNSTFLFDHDCSVPTPRADSDDCSKDDKSQQQLPPLSQHPVFYLVKRDERIAGEKTELSHIVVAASFTDSITDESIPYDEYHTLMQDARATFDIIQQKLSLRVSNGPQFIYRQNDNKVEPSSTA